MADNVNNLNDLFDDEIAEVGLPTKIKQEKFNKDSIEVINVSNNSYLCTTLVDKPVESSQSLIADSPHSNSKIIFTKIKSANSSSFVGNVPAVTFHSYDSTENCAKIEAETDEEIRHCLEEIRVNILSLHIISIY